MNPDTTFITITFGECAENHVGMEQIGRRAPDGFTIAELRAAFDRCRDAGMEPEWFDIPPPPMAAAAPAAAVLVIRHGVASMGVDQPALFAEHLALTPDRHARMYGRVVQKHARWNLCIDDVAAEPDYAAGRGRVVAWADVPLTAALRAALPQWLGPKAADLKAEANYYYDVDRCGIGYHGDTERRRVIGVRLGQPREPLCFYWYQGGERISERYTIPLANGDIYVLSEKAVGTDWKQRRVPTLRHATGAAKFTE